MAVLRDYLATIDGLRARPLPAERHHLADLRVSGDFRDADPAAEEEARETFGDDLDALVRVLSLRWGGPEILDLTWHLERSARGEPVPAPLDTLCGYVSELHTWRVEGRWVAVGVGQGDREFPLRLLVAVGEGDTPY